MPGLPGENLRPGERQATTPERQVRGMAGHVKGPLVRGPRNEKAWPLGQGCLLLARGEVLGAATREHLPLGDGESTLQLGDARLEGDQLPEEHVGRWLAYVAHERFRHRVGSLPSAASRTLCGNGSKRYPLARQPP